MKFHTDWKIVQWHYVEKIVNSDLARIVGMIPIVGYLILFNDKIADMATFRAIAGVEGNNVSPFFLSSLAKMRLIFFGSLLLLIANVIFKALRPQVLELSKGDIEFSIRVRDSYSVHELASMEEHVFADHWKPRLPSFWTVFDSVRTKKALVSGFRPDVRAHMFSKHGDYIHFLAREWWTGMMHTFRIARLASTVLGITGIAFLAVPTLDISQAVLRNILTSFWATLL